MEELTYQQLPLVNGGLYPTLFAITAGAGAAVGTIGAVGTIASAAGAIATIGTVKTIGSVGHLTAAVVGAGIGTYVGISATNLLEGIS